jgi:hypothetical protein
MAVKSWSTTAASNTSVNGSNLAEGMLPSAVNNSIREVVADLATLRDAIGGLKVSGGAADVQTLTTGLGLTAHTQGILLAFEAGFTNTGACTINVDAIGAKSIKTNANADPGAGAITAGGIYFIAYETTADCYRLLNPIPASAGGVDTANTPNANEFARFTDADTIEGRTVSEARTDLELVGQQTIWVPAAAMVARTTNGAASGSMESSTNDVMTKYLAFDSTTSEGAQFAIQMPKSWNEGTIVAQFVWTHPAAVAFGVTWGIRAVAFANDDALDTAFGTEQEVADTGGTTSDVYITGETSAMTVAGSPAAEELVVFEVYRDPNDGGDTMAVDAYLIGLKIHYTTDAARDD